MPANRPPTPFRPFLVAALAAAVGLAGCAVTPGVAPGGAPPGAPDLEAGRLPPPDVDLSGVIVSDHGTPAGHAVPGLHTGSYRMELVGYAPLTRPAEPDALVHSSAYNAVTLHGHLACVMGFVGAGGFAGATVVDFEDPANPTVIASIPTLMVGSRCQFTDDGKYLLVGSYGGVAPDVGLPAPLAGAAGWGVSVYDASDPADPRFLFHSDAGAAFGEAANFASGPYHNFDTETVDGKTYVFQTYRCNVARLADDASGLELVGTLEHCDHDFWTGVHPITGVRMLLTGTSSDGTAFIDITDPEHPITLGTYEPSAGLEGWHRQWPLDELVGGKALVVVAGETCDTGASLPYTVVDWSDPAEPIELGHWQIPGHPEIEGPTGTACAMSAHEFNVHKGYVASGNYHAGAWVFDVGTPARSLEPVTIGYYEPHEDPRLHGGTRNAPFAHAPSVWGAYFDDRGYVIAADWSSGFYVLKVPGITQE